MQVLIDDKIELRRPNDIKPYLRNPRKNEKTVELLVKIIPKVGFNVPIVIDEKGVIVKGHARYVAAIRLGLEKIPCIVSHASKEAQKADRILDNKISEFSEWINDEVLQLIQDIDFDFDFSELGFPVTNFAQMDSHESVAESLVNPAQDLKNSTQARHAESVEEMAGDKPNASESEIKQVNVKRFYKCVCPDCGHVMFIEEGKL